MDFILKIGEYSVSLIIVAIMLVAVIVSMTSVRDTEDYVTRQNESDAYAEKYASLSSFDADSVGKITVQEALTLIMTYAQDSSPVIVRGPDEVVHAYVSSKDGWTYSSNGKPLGKKVDANGNYYNGTFNTCIGEVRDLPTEPVPDYKVLYNYLSANQTREVFYLGNMNPDNTGDLNTFLLVVENAAGGC